MDLTPFSPHLGYQIDNDDYDKEKREAKLLRIKDLSEQSPSFPDYPRLPPDHETRILQVGILDKKFLLDDEGKIPARLLEHLKDLHFRVVVNHETYQSDFHSFGEGHSSFNYFYPMVRGPLAPALEPSGWYGWRRPRSSTSPMVNGLPILLPNKKAAGEISAGFIYTQKPSP